MPAVGTLDFVGSFGFVESCLGYPVDWSLADSQFALVPGSLDFSIGHIDFDRKVDS